MKLPYISSVTDSSKFRIDSSTNGGVSPFVMPTAAEPSPSTQPLQHTMNHISCPACRAELEKLSQFTELKKLKFSSAAKMVWEQEIVPEEFSQRTHEDHEAQMRRLNRFFGELYLEEIHAGHVSAYQKVRLESAGAEMINHEVSFFSRVMDQAGLWKPMKPFVKRLKVPKSAAGRVLTEEERERLILVASSNPRWKVAYLCTLLMVNTPSGPGEIAHIQIKGIDLINRVLSIREGAKNEHRVRDYPMTPEIFDVCRELLRRYNRICKRLRIERSPEHYVLPGRVRGGKFDPTRPIGSWKKAWAALCEKADLEGLRMYDLRHDTCTRLGEDAETSEATIESLMGHSTKKMKRRYMHIRNQAKLEALKRIAVKPAPKIVENGGLIEEIPPAAPASPEKKPAAVPAPAAPPWYKKK